MPDTEAGSLLTTAILLAAAFFAGAMNAMAGGGSFLTPGLFGSEHKRSGRAGSGAEGPAERLSC